MTSSPGWATRAGFRVRNRLMTRPSGAPIVGPYPPPPSMGSTTPNEACPEQGPAILNQVRGQPGCHGVDSCWSWAGRRGRRWDRSVAAVSRPAPTEGRAPSAVPVGLGIPGIGVHTDLIALGLKPDGTIMVQPLDSAAPAGWYPTRGRHLRPLRRSGRSGVGRRGAGAALEECSTGI